MHMITIGAVDDVNVNVNVVNVNIGRPVRSLYLYSIASISQS